MAIVLSGDGGWHDLDKTIAEELQSRGVSVVGRDSVRYFWKKKARTDGRGPDFGDPDIGEK
ncbi:hypothetical protein FJ543_21975 [Mesorhizobium sp. B2-5-7]|nr:hypothetical protein FJ543_21975 [Mesorhizobium sp. B2-5-7]